MIRRFFTYYRPHKKLFALDLICSFIVAVCNIFYPIITKNVLRTYTGDAAEASLSFLLTWAGVLAAIYVVKSVLIYIIDYWGHSLGVRIQGDMRRQMFAKLQRLPFSYFDENKTGSIMSRLITTCSRSPNWRITGRKISFSPSLRSSARLSLFVSSTRC